MSTPFCVFFEIFSNQKGAFYAPFLGFLLGCFQGFSLIHVCALAPLKTLINAFYADTQHAQPLPHLAPFFFRVSVKKNLPTFAHNAHNGFYWHVSGFQFGYDMGKQNKHQQAQDKDFTHELHPFFFLFGVATSYIIPQNATKVNNKMKEVHYCTSSSFIQVT